MLFISHRGNINKINPKRENTVEYIQEALNLGYDVEIDVRTKDNLLFLGHDTPDSEVELEWLLERKQNLWIHCKDFDTLSKLSKLDLNIFFHEKEAYSIISNKKIWAHNILNVDSNCIIPLLSLEDVKNWHFEPVFGICSDFISICKEEFDV
ncbi:MAG: glycerophosphodiester phosphodiesterase family protein [Promethearchaeota archaeon]